MRMLGGVRKRGAARLIQRLLGVILTVGSAWCADAGEFISADGGPLEQHTSKPVQDDPRAFQFAIVADNTGAPRPGVFEQGVEKLSLLEPEFVISVGDLINGLATTVDREEIGAMWDECLGIVDRLDAPFFFVPGNHDIYNQVMREEWEKRFGSPHYAFLYNEVLFLVLNTQDPPRTGFSEAQADWAIETLAKHLEVRWTLVFLHQPLWTYTEPYPAWDRVEKALQDRDYTVFCGHTHDYLWRERFGRHYINLAVTGGGIDNLGPSAFDHLTWVTMTDEGPRVAVLAMEGIHPEDFITVEMAVLLEDLRSGKVLRPSPVWLDDSGAGADRACLVLSNPAEAPVHIRADLPPELGENRKLDEILAPGERKELEYDLALPDSFMRAAPEPLPFTWKGRFELGAKSVEWSGPEVIHIARRLSCPHSREPKQIDALLNDWPELPCRCRVPAEIQFDEETWHGPEDASFRFGVSLDDTYLNIAAEVTDDEIVFSGNPTPWRQDALKIWLDARPEAERNDYAYSREFEDFLLMAFSPGETPEGFVAYKPERQPKGARMACRRTDTGYAVEVAIPLAYLESEAGPDWASFRLNLGVDDYDTDTPQRAEIWWRPSWPEPREYAHSGTFLR